MKFASLILLLFLAGCQSTEKNDLSEFYAGEKLVDDNAFKPAGLQYHDANLSGLADLSDIASLDFVGDNIVLMTKKSNIYILDKEYKQIASFSNDTLKMVGARTVFRKNENEFYIYDLTKNIFHQFVFNRTTNKWQYEKNVELKEALHGLISVGFLPNNSVIATSVNNTYGKVINFALDRDQTVIKYIGTVPKVKKQNMYVTGMEFRSSACFDSSSNQIYVAHFYTDLIEAYDTSGKLLFKVHGPGNFEPIYKIGKQQNIPYFANTNETRVGFHALTCDQNYLYALYSGKTAKDKDQLTTLYIFTKTGAPYKKITFDSGLYQIRADKKNHRLYCYKTMTGEIRKVIYFNTNEL